MPEMVFDSWLLDIYLAWKVFINIPFHMGVRIPSFTFQCDVFYCIMGNGIE